MRTTVRACIKKAATVIRRGRYIGRLLAMAAIIVGVIAGPPMTKKSEQTALASFTLPPAPWGEFTPFYGAAPCIPDFQDVGIFSPADAKADAVVDKLLKKRLLGEDDVADIRKFDEQDRDRRTNRNFQGNLSYRIQTLYTYFEGDKRAHSVDPNLVQTSPTTTIPSRSPLIRPSSSGSSTLYGGNEQDVSDFDVRRFRLQFNGCAYRDMQFHIEIHADGHAIGLRDLDITWTKYPLANVMIGQIKMPNSRERQLSSGATHFAERAFASQGVAAAGRETGIQLSGMDILDVVDYKVMAAAGYGFNKQFQQFDDTGSHVYAGRVTMHPFGRVPFWAGDVWNSWSPLVEFSLTYLNAPKSVAFGEMNVIQSFDLCQAYGLNSTGAQNATAGCSRPLQANIGGAAQIPIARSNINPNAIGDWKDIGFDATLMYRGFYANIEHHNMTYAPNNSNPSLGQFPGLRTMTYAVDLGYFLIPRTWEIVGRYQYMDINKGEVSAPGVAYSLTDPAPTANPTNRKIIDSRWLEFGSVWYLSGDHRHKLGTFGHIRREAGGQFHNNGFSVNLQMAF